MFGYPIQPHQRDTLPGEAENSVINLYYRRFGTRIYNPEANAEALVEKQTLDARRAKQRALYPPGRRG